MTRSSRSISPPYPRWLLLLPMAMATLSFSSLTTAATQTYPNPPHPYTSHPFLHNLLQWRADQRLQEGEEPRMDLRTTAAAVLCFVAAAVSSAGGVGGGSLFLPILNLVAGMDLKVASPVTAFLVTGSAAANVLCNLFFGGGHIDYDVALLSEPCMLLGVTVGVVCNVVFPGWLVTLLFTLLLAGSTYKTCRAGARCWEEESESAAAGGGGEGALCEEVGLGGKGEEGADGEKGGVEEPLLDGEGRGGRGPPWKKVVMLVLIWACFFLLQFLRGNKEGKGLIQVRQCGVGYWLITLSQVPLALLFTVYILYEKGIQQGQHINLDGDIKVPVAETRTKALPNIIFPIAALLSGLLGGLFGIGGGLLINPVLLQIGLPPQITAATCCFMVLFSSSMSSFQYLMLGMKGKMQALFLAMGCSVASLIGLIIIHRAVAKYGRASLIIFSVSTVMVLSTVSITCFGAIDVWKDYIDGKEMGFKLPC